MGGMLAIMSLGTLMLFSCVCLFFFCEIFFYLSFFVTFLILNRISSFLSHSVLILIFPFYFLPFCSFIFSSPIFLSFSFHPILLLFYPILFVYFTPLSSFVLLALLHPFSFPFFLRHNPFRGETLLT